MSIFSRSTFGVARALMAFLVFFCHVSETFNLLGFLFVGVFFFMSGYGMEKSSLRERALSRLPFYILVFFWFSVLYFFFFRVFPYPTSWFLVVYFLVMMLYRFFGKNIYLLLISFALLSYFFASLSFEFGWSASFGAFLFGVFFARNESRFVLANVICLVPCVFLFVLGCEAALWSLLPLFSYLVLKFSSLKILRPISFLGQYTLYFFCVHCLFLGLFGCTWTLGGSPDFIGVSLSFLLSCFAALLMNDYLFKYPRI